VVCLECICLLAAPGGSGGCQCLVVVRSSGRPPPSGTRLLVSHSMLIGGHRDTDGAGFKVTPAARRTGCLCWHRAERRAWARSETVRLRPLSALA
jgi:hypothetical protein